MRPIRVDRTAVSADWKRRGYTCELWVDPPDRIWHDVQHEADLLLLLLEGELQIELVDRTLSLAAGDEVAIPAHTRFTIRHASQRPARWLHGYRRPIEGGTAASQAG